MKITIQSPHTRVSQALLDHVEEMMRKLGNKHEEILEAKIDFRHAEDDGAKRNSVTILLNVPGHQVYTHTHNLKHEVAFAEAYKKIEHQLEKAKGKYFSHPTGTLE